MCSGGPLEVDRARTPVDEMGITNRRIDECDPREGVVGDDDVVRDPERGEQERDGHARPVPPGRTSDDGRESVRHQQRAFHLGELRAPVIEDEPKCRSEPAQRCRTFHEERDSPVADVARAVGQSYSIGVIRGGGFSFGLCDLQAWDAMQQPGAPALGILDWMMPGLFGLEVCRLVRGLQSDQSPYLILLISKGEKADIVAGLEAGADDYLEKPFDPGELRARIDVGRRIIDLQARLLEARDALAHESSHDPLTGALNRRAFADALTRAISAEGRHHDGLALGICDVDLFRAVNDTYGHQVGDEVLVGLVGLLSRSLCGHDVPGRYGGDEFVVLAWHANEGDAATLFERVRAAGEPQPLNPRA